MIQRQTISKENALSRLEELCARGERCTGELAEKLRRWGVLSTDAQEIIASLKERRFVDDSRFASAYVRDKLRYGRWGKRKIYLGLMAKRIDSAMISAALDEIDEEEYVKTAREFLTAKARSVKEGYTYEGRTRLYRAGLSRGFESSVVAPIVKDPAIWPEHQ